MEHLNSLDYTETAWESFYAAVDDSNFADKDAELIFETLNKKMRFISFADYLKRYIYKRAGLEEPFSSVGTATYQQIIKDSFAENNTPCSFKPTTAKLSALSKNWLTQDTVKRNVVFLLAFGLNMSVEDVNMFLTKALCEQGINPKDPFEVICWYCIKNGYSFIKYEKLYEIYETLEPKPLEENINNLDKTVVLSCSMNSLENDRALIDYLAAIKGTASDSLIEHTAYNTFFCLYEEARGLIVRIYNDSEDATKIHTIEDITESDFERIICSSVPKDRHGNLTAAGKSQLNSLFHGRRFSRQHIGELLAKETGVTRFDLITLNFFIFSQTTERFKNVRERYTEFVDSTDRILKNCFLNGLIVQNPYECFVLMCIVSEDPLGTYADVWEMSYVNEGSKA
ncbi:MAG: hypothetical protein J5717_00625 [Lachnospiraceae bacterium]|nr:hypothetical protein [Lachnospiraceae bacterium]